MRFYVPFLSLLISFIAHTSVAQDDRCSSDELQAALMEDSTYARSYFAFEAALAEMSGSALRSSDAYILPVVVHIMHDGASTGNGSNISDSQVLSAIDALNADFRGDFGGANVDIGFSLAVRDPEGNPTTGIVRTDVSDVIPSFSSTGMVTTSNLDPASEMNVKNLSHWPGSDYINVWVLHKLNGGSSPLGFAYLPPTSGTHDGVVLHHQVFGVGDEFDLLNNFNLNRTLTHEMGHYLSLLHTFNNTSSCADESNCSSQGDRVCDTPPTTGSIGCSAMSCPETMVENFMDYSNDGCMEAFTEGQRTRMRDALLSHRNSLLNSDGTIPVMSTDMGLASVQGIASAGCASSISPEVLLQNFGSEPLTSATVHFSLDGGTANAIEWTGDLPAGGTAYFPLPSLAASDGDHDLSVWINTPNDGYALNDTLNTSFEVLTGSFVNMEIQLDVLPFGFSWSVENTDNGAVVMSGANYDNGTFAGDFIAESQCATTGCYELTVNDLFGNGLHYPPGGWYTLTDDGGNVLGSGTGNFGSGQTHAFCIDGSSVDPCEDANANDICDSEEDMIVTDVPGCTDASSCTYNDAANVDDGSCEYLDALGECGGDCPGDADGDNVCDNAEIPGCTDQAACNFAEDATEENGGCEYAATGYDCDGNLLNVIEGCTDEASCTYDAAANTDDGSCDYLDALGECGGDCPSDNDGDGICDNAEIPGCTDQVACNFAEDATEENGGCEYAAAGYDCDGNLLNVIEGCTDEASCTYDAAANTDDGSCEYLDALGECGGECEADIDEDGICDSAEIVGCTDLLACNYDDQATEESGGCEYASEGFDCEGEPLTSNIGEIAGMTSPLTPFPNPSEVGNDIQVSGLSNAGPWLVSMWSSAGKLIHTRTISAEPQLGTWSLNLSAPGLPGMYLVRVVSPNHTGAMPAIGRLIVR